MIYDFACGCSLDHGTWYPCDLHLAWGWPPDEEPPLDESQPLVLEEAA